jgi:hypothetical protein
MITDLNNNLGKLNDIAKPYFTKFFSEIQSYVDEIIITGVIYSYADSVKLHNKDSRNPIWNFHEFGIAVDLNIRINNRRFVKADIIDDWIKTGVISDAEELGIRWGGRFNGYPDCVHFDIANILIKKYNLNNVYELISYLENMAKNEFGNNLMTAELNRLTL